MNDMDRSQPVVGESRTELVEPTRAGLASRLVGQSGLVVVGNVFTLLVGLPFQIYVARTLGADSYGAFGMFETVAQTAAALFGFGLATTVVRFVPQHIELRQFGTAKDLLRRAYLLCLAFGLLGAVLVLASRDALIYFLPELDQFLTFLPLAAAMTVLGLLIGLSTQALRAFFDIKGMVLFSSVLQLTLKVVIAVVLFWLGWRLGGYMVAVVASLALSLMGMMIVLRRHVKGLGAGEIEPQSSPSSDWWSFARIMYVTSLIGITLPFLERVILAKAIDLASVGVLMAVRQLQAFPVVILQVLITVIAPMFVVAKAKGDLGEVRHLYHISVDWIARVGGPLVIFLLTFGDQILGHYGIEFAERGRWPLVILVLSQSVNLLTGPLGAMLNMLGHERTMFKLGMASNVVLLVLLFWLGPILGLLGVALASGVSTMLLNGITLVFLRKRMAIGWWSNRYARLAFPLCVTGLVAAALRYMCVDASAWYLLVALGSLYVSFGTVYLSRGLSAEDREILDMIRARLSPSSV